MMAKYSRSGATAAWPLVCAWSHARALQSFVEPVPPRDDKRVAVRVRPLLHLDARQRPAGDFLSNALSARLAAAFLPDRA